jgi:hypothetical protein
MTIAEMGFVASFPPGGMGCDSFDHVDGFPPPRRCVLPRGHRTAHGDYRRHPEAARAIAGRPFATHTVLERLADCDLA